MSDTGGIIPCVLRGETELATQRIGQRYLFTLTESLGGVERLICQPFSMTPPDPPDAAVDARYPFPAHPPAAGH
ncbi:hypothetical protein ACM3CZ_16865 [Edwardsiella ictaluri]|uniref:hypothetical protein n=1 Tax=Edwardsiella ictaluri TaxID=67780 RepID=UPI003A598CCF